MRMFGLVVLTASFLLVGCGNKDYENCLAREKESLAKFEKALAECDKVGDAAKKQECVDTAKQGHFTQGCDALK